MATTGTMDAHWLAMTWSLAVEEQFYLILPLFIRVIPLAWLPISLSLLIVSAPIMRATLYCLYPGGGLAGYVLLPTRWDALFLGVFGAWLLRNRGWREWLIQRRRLCYYTLAVTLTLTFGLMLMTQGIGSLGMAFGGHTVLALFSLTLIILALIDEQSLISRLVTLRPLIWLGTVSYGVYLFHQPIAGLLHHCFRQQEPKIVDLQDALITSLALVVTCGVSAFSWHYFERPIVEYGQHWRYGQSS